MKGSLIKLLKIKFLNKQYHNNVLIFILMNKLIITNFKMFLNRLNLKIKKKCLRTFQNKDGMKKRKVLKHLKPAAYNL